MANKGFLVGTGVGIRETDKAVLVRVEEPSDDAEEHVERNLETWLPRSQIHDDSEVYGEGHSGTIIITEFLARQKEWLE